MRATFGQVLRRPSWFGAWLYELPGRRLSWWSWLLFERGQGWLRWATDERWTPVSYDPPEPPEPYCVAPPLRRLWFYVRWSIHWRERATWRECWDHFRDEDRKRGNP